MAKDARSLAPQAQAALRQRACKAVPGGMTQVEAARGRLVHRVEVAAGRVSNYRILAPTEWNFHPKGVLACSLLDLEVDNESSLKQSADLLINAIDPCVGYQLRINRLD